MNLGQVYLNIQPEYLVETPSPFSHLITHQTWHTAMDRCLLALCITLIPASDALAASPIFPIFGSYFPAWVVCAVLGAIITVIVRRIFISTGINDQLPLAPVVYLCLAIVSSIALWLVWTV